MTKMAAVVLYDTTLKNLLSRRYRRADFDDETWYEAPETQTIIFCSNYNPMLTLTYFMARSNNET